MGKKMLLEWNTVACTRQTHKNHTKASKKSVENLEIFSAVMYNQSEGILCRIVSVMHVAIITSNKLS